VAQQDPAPADVMPMALLPAPSVTCVDVAHEAILVEESLGRAYPLNATGALVWACLDGESTLEEICGDLSDVLAVPLERVEQDVEVIARRFLDTGLATAPDYHVDRSETDSHGPGCCGPPLPPEEVQLQERSLADGQWIPEPPNP